MKLVLYFGEIHIFNSASDSRVFSAALCCHVVFRDMPTTLVSSVFNSLRRTIVLVQLTTFKTSRKKILYKHK